MQSKHVILLKNKTTPVDPYHDKLIESGFSPLFIPLLDHIHLDKYAIATYLQTDMFLNSSAFIITSQRAVEVLNETMALIDEGSIKESIFAKPAYTVGPATAKILSSAGFKDIRGGSEAGNGTILSEIIVNDQLFRERMEKEVIFFTGEIRKDIIPRKLADANFKLVERVIYKTVLKDHIIERFHEAKKFCQSDDDWVVFFSPQGAEEIVEYIGGNLDQLHRLKVASIGPTTELYLLEHGITPDIVAKKPEAVSLSKSILDHANGNAS